MNMKDCPKCGATVPAVARLCKHCFHDFQAEPKKSSNNLVGFLVLLVLLAGIGTATFGYIVNTNAAEEIVIDPETQSIIITRTTANGTTTTRLHFEDIAKIEYIKSPGQFEVVAITTDDTRYTIQQSEQPLESDANGKARVIDCPLVEVNNMPSTSFAPPSD